MEIDNMISEQEIERYYTTREVLPEDYQNHLDQYEVPASVISTFTKECSCCPICQQKPCDGVMAGGMCDDACDCQDEESIEQQSVIDFDNELIPF